MNKEAVLKVCFKINADELHSTGLLKWLSRQKTESKLQKKPFTVLYVLELMSNYKDIKNFVAKPGTSKDAGKVQSLEAHTLFNTLDNFCRVPCQQVPVYIHFTCLRLELGTVTGGNSISEEH